MGDNKKRSVISAMEEYKRARHEYSTANEEYKRAFHEYDVAYGQEKEFAEEYKRARHEYDAVCRQEKEFACFLNNMWGKTDALHRHLIEGRRSPTGHYWKPKLSAGLVQTRLPTDDRHLKNPALFRLLHESVLID